MPPHGINDLPKQAILSVPLLVQETRSELRGKLCASLPFHLSFHGLFTPALQFDYTGSFGNSRGAGMR